jgi:hypothetical protein
MKRVYTLRCEHGVPSGFTGMDGFLFPVRDSSRQEFFNQTEPAHRGVSCLQQTPLGIVNNVPLRAAGKLTAAERRNE